MLSSEQIEIVDHLYGPAAVLAGAGSGKTLTLVERLQKLADITDSSRIVLLTFSNAAAREMAQRAHSKNNKCKQVVASTYHKYCSAMLRKYGSIIGIYRGFDILDERKYRIFIDYIKDSNDVYETLENFPSASKLSTIFSTITNTDRTIGQCIRNTKYHNYEDEIETLYREVKKEGLAQQKLCYDDLLVYMNELLNNDTICEKIAKSFDFLMIDEFQDTNDLQLQIILKLSKYNSNIVVVGDTSQSIYKFRGAVVKNIQKFIDSFENCKTYTLSNNYRSTQEILDAANAMMNHNVFSWKYTNMVSAYNRHGDKPEIIKHFDENDQIEWILNRIQEEMTTEKRGLDEIAIIERHSTASFKLESALNKAGIPFVKKGGKKFLDYEIVSIMMSFLAVIVNDTDKFNWFTLFKLLPGIGPSAASKIAESCNKPDFWTQYSKRKYYNDLSDLVFLIKNGQTMQDNVPKLLESLGDYYFALESSKIDNSKKSSSAKFDAREKLNRDKDIFDILKNLSSQYSSVSSFLDDVALDAVKDNVNEETSLKITTIHSAKGLEWPVVILLDCIASEMSDEEEELRCWYVAMTRAEENLYISIPQHGFINGKPSYNEVIQFIHGLENPYFTEK